ncbi:LOW QUALITY PROTEIN: diphthine methyltransferase [Rhagoletis pomonella]|uniref:LOW QUALITY PROTEIN: diphthine methyltransferase n=1 Tax=Rhagoletis pomonella TaxID=28610 RepID=UPI00177FD6D6|nr:LOW QUALITY PROTEIN: diphthine methyltransferase [Rhagoletis pomonella]
MQKLKFTTLHSVDTEFSADSIEWCPHPNFQSYFACGTYQLEEHSSNNIAMRSRRKGRIYLYKFCTSTKRLIEMHRVETAAVLDMKWLVGQANENPLLGVVDSFGQLQLYELENCVLKMTGTLELNPDIDDILALSLDWRHSRNSVTSQFQILVSDSKGGVNLIDYEPECELKKSVVFAAHGFEAWTCAFDKWDSNCIYSGGDDVLLLAYDLRSGTCIFTNKSHNAGVTCLLSHPLREHLLLTGSYDEHLRTFDTRLMKQPLGELNLGGGIWRLKADPFKCNLILAACMYHNFSVVQLVDGLVDGPKLIGEYYEHKSICYGADWCRHVDDNQDLYTATCSFYDHKLCVAQIDEEDR